MIRGKRQFGQSHPNGQIPEYNASALSTPGDSDEEWLSLRGLEPRRPPKENYWETRYLIFKAQTI
jgi:hypothetical protein